MAKKTKGVRVWCYWSWDEYDSLRAAKKFYLDCMAGSEGAERDRYVEIYMQLERGWHVCSDRVYRDDAQRMEVERQLG